LYVVVATLINISTISICNLGSSSSYLLGKLANTVKDCPNAEIDFAMFTI